MWVLFVIPCINLWPLGIFFIQVIPKLNLVFLMSHEKILKQTSKAPHITSWKTRSYGCFSVAISLFSYVWHSIEFFYLSVGLELFLCCKILNNNIIKLSTFRFILIFCVSVCLHACMYTMCIQVPAEVRREYWILWNWSHRWCELSCRCWKWHSVLFTSKLTSPALLFKWQ